ncbi:hypothetical protein ACP70R_029491 [Stipagrostis hirtigluma subsp. patula]
MGSRAGKGKGGWSSSAAAGGSADSPISFPSSEGRTGSPETEHTGDGRQSRSASLPSSAGGGRSRGRSGSSSGSERSSSSAASETEMSSPPTPPDSEPEIPPSLEESDWGGVARGTGYRCRHGRRPRRKVCYAGKHTGRRFLGCPLEEDDDQCRFVKWCDPEWPMGAQRAMVDLWGVVHDSRLAEEAARRQMQEAVRAREEAVRRHTDEVRMTKTVAQNACAFYERMYEEKKQEKKRAWMVAFIVGGLLVSVIFRLVLKRGSGI